MSDDERAAVPTPVGPLGVAMADLVSDPPATDVTAWTVIGEVRRRRSVRHQVLGGLAAGVAAIGVLLTIGLVVAGGGGSSSTATSASSSAASASTSAAALLSVPSSPVTSSGTSASVAAAGSAATTSAATTSAESAPALSVSAGSADPAVPELPSAAPAAESGGGEPTVVAACVPLPFTPEQLALIAGRLPGLTPQSSCAADDVELAVQDFTVDAAPGVTLRAEVRAGTYDPCAEVVGSVCVDDGSGAISTERIRGGYRDILVWVSGRAGSTVLTLTTPVDVVAPLTVDALATVVVELAATR